jgi:cytochrome c
MDDRFNTIAGWVLFAGIVALGGSIVAGEVFKSERPEKMGYPIAGVVEEGAAVAEKPIEFYLASADPAKGAQTFQKCQACHNADKGGANQIGPNLWGILGAPIGQDRNGFAFSDALAKKGGNWNWDLLSQWLTSPKAFAPGTKMTFAGLSDPQERANVIAYLNKQSDSPLPMPAPPAAPKGSPTAGGAAGKPAAAANGSVPGQKAAKEPVPTEQQATAANKVAGPAAPNSGPSH